MITAKSTATPMMAQYFDIKENYPEAVLFYRMGDFYELFFEDAALVSDALDIALTKRGKHDGADIPMCGVPVHAVEASLRTLIKKGFRIAVCEQMESPAEAKKRPGKPLIKRDVVRLVTPGTLSEDSLLDARSHNYLAAFTDVNGDCAMAWVDISTGAFQVTSLDVERLSTELARLNPSEIIISDTLPADIADAMSATGAAVTPISARAFETIQGEKRICDVFEIASLDAFGNFPRAAISAMSALIEYIDITQKGKLPLLRPPQKENSRSTMQIDAATRLNLELTQGINGGRIGSLLSVIDKTVTSGGGRLLEQRLSGPSCDLNIINNRLDAVSWFYDNSHQMQDIRESLRKIPDFDRALSRLALERGGPRDLAAIRTGLQQAEAILDIGMAKLPNLLTSSLANLRGHAALIERLSTALIDAPPLLARDGGFIASGFDKELDDTRAMRDEGRNVIASMQQHYIGQTGVAALKIKHNNVLGYFIETTAVHTDKMMTPPLNETFIHRQTTANQLRFTTVELSNLEIKLLNAGHHALALEKRHFQSLTKSVLDKAAKISQTASAMAEIDLNSSLAELAQSAHWIRPKVDDSRMFHIKACRHPVVEQALKTQSGAPFIANDCDLSDGSDGAHIWLLTGPNMAGKSTFLRQNALVAVLAQMGSFVPASEAHIGIVSQLFSRVGASDDLARGRSTFMVEMVETAAILNQADAHALVILDEIGRGTATYDGLSIAWATLEHLHDVNKSRALFATHYHELTKLCEGLNGAENATVAVREWEGDVIFLYEVVKGTADRSYGVQVAKLAGLPEVVVDRARGILEILEKGQRDGVPQIGAIDDLLTIAAASSPQTGQKTLSPAMEMFKMVEDTQPDQLSPRDALALIYKLKATQS